MILNGRVARIDVNDNTAIITAEGIHVGDSEERALQAYGKRLKVTPHAYVPGGHYLTTFSTDRKYGIRYESEDGAVTRYYAGTAEAISFIEGCE